MSPSPLLSRGVWAWLKRSARLLTSIGLMAFLSFAVILPVQANPQRDAFLEAEKVLATGQLDAARRLMIGLEKYPLFGYLELAATQIRIATLNHDSINAVLQRHGDVPGASALRYKWLKRLSREGRHQLVLQHFADNGHTASTCLAAESARRSGREAEAWVRAERLWQTGRSLPDDCDAVLGAWRKAGHLTPALAWRRFELAMEKGNLRLARYLARLIPPGNKRLAEDWLRLRGAPKGLTRFARDMDQHDSRQARVLHHVFARAARKNPKHGRELFKSLTGTGLSTELLDPLRESLGEALARQRAPDALKWLQRATGVKALTARALEGIRIGRLDDVAAAVAAMPEEEARRERWQYWQARGLEGTDPAGAKKRFIKLAMERSYYGFVAADRVQLPYAFGNAQIPENPKQIRRIARIPGAVRAREWLALDRAKDARREWALLLKSVDTTSQHSAARLAHEWRWHEAAIRAAAAAQHWSDLELRFPLAHGDAVREAAKESGLPRSRVYAVVRQESAFMRDIRSSAGALGLMQLMPATARLVARKAGMPRPNRQSILEPRRNLKLGSLYMHGLERRYDGHRVLATAAYNAGPGRVKQWRPRGAAMSSDVWIELIPFRETRRYVRSVLAYQLIYAERLGESGLKISEMMPDVPPG